MTDLRDLYLGKTQYQAVISTLQLCAEVARKCKSGLGAEQAIRELIPAAVRKFESEQEDRT